MTIQIDNNAPLDPVNATAKKAPIKIKIPVSFKNLLLIIFIKYSNPIDLKTIEKAAIFIFPAIPLYIANLPTFSTIDA